MAGLFNSDKINPAEYQYDVVSGISGGAVNAVLLSSYNKGQEKDAAAKMEKFWRDASKTSLWRNWIGGLARGLFFEGGLYYDGGLQSFIKQQVSHLTIKRDLDIGIVDTITGKYTDFSHQNITEGQNLNDGLFASMSYAGFFPPAHVLGSYYFDGTA